MYWSINWLTLVIFVRGTNTMSCGSRRYGWGGAPADVDPAVTEGPHDDGYIRPFHVGGIEPEQLLPDLFRGLPGNRHLAHQLEGDQPVGPDDLGFVEFRYVEEFHVDGVPRAQSQPGGRPLLRRGGRGDGRAPATGGSHEDRHRKEKYRAKDLLNTDRPAHIPLHQGKDR